MSTADTERDQRLLQQLRHALGADILEALADPDVTDIQVNPDGRLWLAGHSRGRYETTVTLATAHRETIVAGIAGILRTEITEKHPILHGELPLDGNRIVAELPPVVSGPSFAIRKKPTRIYSLNDYVAARMCSETQAEAIRATISAERPFLVAGGTGSGKTTLSNAILGEIVDLAPAGPAARFVIIEDTVELQCKAPNTKAYRALRDDAGAAVGQGRSVRECLRASLRNDPDYIVVGELRGAEAYDLLQAWNTGHGGGLTTIHANDAQRALLRLDQLAQEAHVPPQQGLIAGLDITVVFIAGKGAARSIRELALVDGLDARNEYRLERLA